MKSSKTQAPTTKETSSSKLQSVARFERRFGNGARTAPSIFFCTYSGGQSGLWRFSSSPWTLLACLGLGFLLTLELWIGNFARP